MNKLCSVNRYKFLAIAFLMTCCNQLLAFESAVLEPGKEYYFFNVYQNKFLSLGSGMSSKFILDDAHPLCSKIVAGTGGEYMIENLKFSGQAFLFNEVEDGYNIVLSSNSNKALMYESGVDCEYGELNYAYNADKAIWQLLTQEEYDAYKAKKRFSVAAMNVDGMPRRISVPASMSWIMGRTFEINPDGREAEGALGISKSFRTLGWDVIGVCEDFNFHEELRAYTYNGGVDNENGYSYSTTTFRGVLDDINILKFMKNEPLFDSDGLCLFYKRSMVDHDMICNSEKFATWNDYCGYTDHQNDGLIRKGFRSYAVQLADGAQVDVYILHMDADDGGDDIQGDINARESQIHQLVEVIKSSSNGRPIIVMGDFNCRYTQDRLKELFIDYLDADARFEVHDPWIELRRHGVYPNVGDLLLSHWRLGVHRGEVVDKILYVNNTESDIRIEPLRYTSDLSFVDESGEPLSDHWPVVCEFEYKYANAHIWGDIDGNGVVNTDDVNLLKDIILRKGEYSKDVVTDLNDDGETTMADVAVLIDILNNDRNIQK